MIRSVPSSSSAAPSTGGRAAEPVVLVGAGPGDPDLLTVRAARAIARADVILADDLVDGRVLELARPDARVVHVGKRGGRASTSQAFIERLLIHEARSGRRVVRLKGGDPFVFGRGGEELNALHRAGLEVEVIPGITAGIAAPAAAGIPVTDRRHAPGVAFVTGHTQPDGNGPRWDALARSGLTLVIYMGLARSAEITAALQSAGLVRDNACRGDPVGLHTAAEVSPVHARGACRRHRAPRLRCASDPRRRRCRTGRADVEY